MAKEHFVRTCRRTVLHYVENKVPLALKRSVAAHRFLKKICFNEGYLSGPKVCIHTKDNCIVTEEELCVECPQLGYEHPHVRTPGLGSNGLGGIPGGKP